MDKLNEGDTAMFDLGFIGLQNDWGDVEIILPLRKPKGWEWALDKRPTIGWSPDIEWWLKTPLG